jgi:serine/threonine protein kinase
LCKEYKLGQIMQNMIGQSLGRYHLIEKLGEGGMAVVYKAFDTRLECEVAVKVIRMERLTQEMMATTLKRFEREAKAVAQLNHPNIVNITDYGEYEGVPYLVMEYLRGGTLKQMLGKPMPYAEAARLLAPVASALQYAHEHKVIHRDVKPSNILITESGAPMLTDFGIARILDLQEGQTLTGTGVGIGTPEYMAPEQWTGDITPAVDIYSLGVVFYELVTGHKPYTADTPAAVLIKTINDPLPRPSQYAPGLPENVEKVIYKAMAKKAEDRYSNIGDFERILTSFSHKAYPDAKIKTGMEYFVDESATFLENEPIESKSQIATKTEAITDITDKKSLVTILEKRREKESPVTILKVPGIRYEAPSLIERFVDGKGLYIASIVLLAAMTMIIFLVKWQDWFTPRLEPISSPTATFTPVITTMTSAKDGMTMLFIPGGEFIMGSSESGSNEEKRNVYLPAYWIDMTEITTSEYDLCVQAGVCKPSNQSASYFSSLEYKDYPVTGIDWQAAVTYCEWAGRRLPTEAEWEKAARGTDGRNFPWGNNDPTCSLGNLWLTGENKCVGNISKVGTYSAGQSPYGALDMAGNVWEWVSTNYMGGEAYANSMVVRGGSWGGAWYGHPVWGWTHFRVGINPLYTSNDIGFRCAMTATN